MQAEQKEKDRTHQEKVEMRNTVRQWGGEKRSLLIQYAAESQKKNKAMADAIMEQINHIQMEIDENNNKILLLESTPKKNNKTPESAIDD